MQIKKEIDSLFLRLVRDEEFASRCFSSINIKEFDNRNYLKLKRNAQKSTRDFKNNTHKPIIINNNELNNGTLRNFVDSHKMLEVFESKLAYMLFYGIITLKDASVLGYSDEYVDTLMEFYENEMKNQYIQYNLDESNERLSVINVGNIKTLCRMKKKK